MNLSALDLNLLVALDAVLSERSVARAARRLHVTSPAVSNALARLRAALGDPIVTRSGRGIVPTPRALQLQPAIRGALHDLETALQGDTFDPATATVQLTLAVADAGQLARVPRLVAMLAQRMPRARLRIVNVDTMVALGGLASSEVDLAIGVSDPAPGIRREQIYAERSIVVVRDGHPRLHERATARALAAERHVEVHPAVGKGSRAVARAYARLGIDRDIAVIVPTFVAAAAIAAASELVATIPASVVHSLSPALGLRTLRTPLRVAPTPMYMSWHRRTDADPAQRELRALVAETCSDRRST